MNFADEDEFNLTEGVRHIERRFCRFYLNAIKDYFKLGKNFVWTAKEMSKLRNYGIKKQFVINQAHELLLLSIQDTCLGLRKFYNSLMKYKEIATYLSMKDPVVIYCVIGESLFAALGMCIVIDKAVEEYGLSNKTNTKQIQLIITDKVLKWKTICFYIVERVNSCYNNVEIKLEFFEEQSVGLSGEVYRRLKEADIVVMSRYLSRFQRLTNKPHFLEFILRRMKELSILFYLDVCQEKYKDTVKHVFQKTDSLIEIKSKKTKFQSLEDRTNGEYFSEFPFLFNAGFEEVTYSFCIQCFSGNHTKPEQRDTKNDVSLLKQSRKQMKRKISERFAKETLLLSQLKTEASNFDNKSNSKVFKPHKVVGNPVIRKHENKNMHSKVGTQKSKTLITRKGVRKSEAANPQKKYKYKCPYLATERRISRYANYLSEIYYSKYIDKEFPCSPKIK